MQDGNEDLELSARSARGDQQAFSLLVAKHERALRSFLLRLGEADAVDDIAQEAFLKAWRFAGRFDGRSRYSTWLTKIAWRCWLDRRRSRQDRDGQEQEVAEEQPDQPLLVDDMLGRLAPSERAALILCEGHGWTHSEAAELLGVPLGTLKSAVARAKSKCRQMWNGDTSDR